MSTSRQVEYARDDEEVERLTTYVCDTCARARQRGSFDAEVFASRESDAWFFTDPNRWIREGCDEAGCALRRVRVMCLTTRRAAARRVGTTRDASDARRVDEREVEIYIALAMQVFAVAGEVLRAHIGSSEEADAVAARLLDVYKIVVSGAMARPVEWSFCASSSDDCARSVVSFARAHSERTLPNVAFSAFTAVGQPSTVGRVDKKRRTNDARIETTPNGAFTIFQLILERSPSNAVKTLALDVLLSLLLQNVRIEDADADADVDVDRAAIDTTFKGAHADMVMSTMKSIVAPMCETFDKSEIITARDAPPSPFASAREKGVMWSSWTRAFLIKHMLGINTRTEYSDGDISDLLTIFSCDDDLMALLKTYFSRRNAALRVRLLAASSRNDQRA